MDIIWYKNFFPSWIMAGVTIKSFGDIKNPDNQKKLAKILDIASSNLYSLKQEHTVIIREIGIDSRLCGNDSGSLIGDGLFTQEKNVCLLIKTADCVPVLMADVKKQIIMALHVGRINLFQGVVSKGIEILLKEKSSPKNLKVFLGPFIEKKCYPIDLESMIRRQLQQYGILDKQIVSAGQCTYCLNDKYFSHRRGDKERMGTFICI